MQSNPYRSPVETATGTVSLPDNQPLLQNHIGRAHLLTLLVIWACFTAFTYWIADRGIGHGPDHNRLVLRTTCATALGPMTGAISRGCQSCCLRNSLGLLPYCGLALTLGIMPQFIRLRIRHGAKAMRLVAWNFGLLGWFLGGPVSFLHALN